MSRRQTMSHPGAPIMPDGVADRPGAVHDWDKNTSSASFASNSSVHSGSENTSVGQASSDAGKQTMLNPASNSWVPPTGGTTYFASQVRQSPCHIIAYIFLTPLSLPSTVMVAVLPLRLSWDSSPSAPSRRQTWHRSTLEASTLSTWYSRPPLRCLLQLWDSSILALPRMASLRIKLVRATAAPLEPLR